MYCFAEIKFQSDLNYEPAHLTLRWRRAGPSWCEEPSCLQPGLDGRQRSVGRSLHHSVPPATGFA